MGIGSILPFLVEYGVIESEIVSYGINPKPTVINEGNDGIDILHTIGKYGWESLRWYGQELFKGVGDTRSW